MEKNLGPVTALVLRCKKELWEKKENDRLKVRNGLLEEMCGLIRSKKENELAALNMVGEATKEQTEEVERTWRRKEEELRRVWDTAAEGEGKRRAVPDWAIDNITFAVMHDPVMVSLNLCCFPVRAPLWSIYMLQNP